MAESTLALKKSDLQVSLAVFLGWGRGDAFDEEQTEYQISRLKEYVDSGCRQFYWPVLPNGEVYEWSFMKPVATLTLAADASTVQLPDDFGGVEGQITVANADGEGFDRVQFVGIGQVYAKQSALPAATGRPCLACIEPLKGTTNTKGQREQLRVWPIADQTYTISFAYYLLPDCLSDNYPYAYGGAAHAETLLEACKAAAELGEDDQLGVHRQMFAQRLIASANMDRRLKPQLMSYNGDRSDYRQSERRRWHGEDSQVTYDGVSY